MTDRSSKYRRRGKKPRGRPARTPHSGRRRPSEQSDPPFEPRVHPKLAPVLEHIGAPEAAPFVPDPFQVRSVELLNQADVVVSAPTGSGKTWIAEKAIARALAAGQRAWYASPLKALSNAKYAEFGEIFGPENVGILTGERKENLSARLIVGTTEILRNQLYDAMHKGRDLDAGLVVLDEAHFLGDPDRGVVWEEVIIYLPVRVRLLLLSATVQNAGQIARWLNYVRDAPCETVLSSERPVPLFPAFFFPDGELTPLVGRTGLFPKVRHFVERKKGERPRGPRSPLPPFTQVLAATEHADLLPAIFFLKSRSDCDAALTAVAGARLRVEPERREALGRYLDEYLEQYPFVAGHPHIGYLRNLHVAAHHAGHLPHWKLLVERLMQRGLLRAIFSTSTVAAGVNFPARTVVITQSDRFNGRDFVDLTATDLLQMTGRAGRRGMDNIGFCLAVPGPFNDVPLLAGLLNAEPEPIRSQIHIGFSMALNLLLSQRPAEVKQLLSMSLATFQRLEERQQRPGEGMGLQRSLRPLAAMLDGSGCPGPEEAVVRRRRRSQLLRTRRRLQEEFASLDGPGAAWGALQRGRVIMDMMGEAFAVLRRESHGRERGALAVSLTPDRRLQRGRPRLGFVALEEMTGFFAEVLDLPYAGGGRALAQAVLDQAPARPTPLSEPEVRALAGREEGELGQRLLDVDEELAAMACGDCPVGEECLGSAELARKLDEAADLLARVQEESHAFWYDFVRHLEFLRSEGLAGPSGELTPDGLWASKLRLDHPVLIAEAIRRGALPQGDPVLLASLVALFVDEREREGESPYLGERLKQGIVSLQAALDPMLNRLRQWGFSTPPMPPASAAAVFSWAMGAAFEDAVAVLGAAEGDLAQLIYRVADNLRQVISLQETHPELATSAREALDLILRPPVVVPV